VGLILYFILFHKFFYLLHSDGNLFYSLWVEFLRHLSAYFFRLLSALPSSLSFQVAFESQTAWAFERPPDRSFLWISDGALAASRKSTPNAIMPLVVLRGGTLGVGPGHIIVQYKLILASVQIYIWPIIIIEEWTCGAVSLTMATCGFLYRVEFFNITHHLLVVCCTVWTIHCFFRPWYTCLPKSGELLRAADLPWAPNFALLTSIAIGMVECNALWAKLFQKKNPQ
jgi:hypothetical protein